MSSVTGFSSVQQWLALKRKERVEMLSWRLPCKMQECSSFAQTKPLRCPWQTGLAGCQTTALPADPKPLLCMH